jgi:ribose 5-phosphate isomerase A
LLAVRCDKYIFLGDKTKLVDDLVKVPVPIEVFPEMVEYVKSELNKLGAKDITLRQATTKYGAVLTESGFMILDVIFNRIDQDLESKIKQITGVVESGLFSNHADEVLIATEDKIVNLKR